MILCAILIGCYSETPLKRTHLCPRLGCALKKMAAFTWKEACVLFSRSITDLKNRTGSSIYCWENEANGGHIGGTT